MKRLLQLCRLPLPLLLLPLFSFSQQPGDSLFNSSIVHDIRITFSQNGWWDTLTANYQLTQQTNQDTYIPANIIIDGNARDSVGVRLKGNASYNNPGMKKPLKLSFNEYVSGQTYDGLKSLHLNNSAFDPTMLREKLMLDVLKRHGLPAPRCTFAAVYFNGSYVGLYKIIESIDKTFLQGRFGYNDGNLYKGDPYGTLKWYGPNQEAYYGEYELKTNETLNDWTSLVDLISAINNTGASFPQQVRQRLDVDSYLWTLAANNLFVNLDSYLYNPHNYYLFDDSASGRFRWVSWDVGLAFGVFPTWWQSRSQSLDIFYLPDDPSRVPLNAQLFAHEEFRNIYLGAMCTLLNEDFNPQQLFTKIDSLAGVIRPYVYAEPVSNRMYTTEQFEGNLGYTSYSAWFISSIPGLKDFVAQRRGDVAKQLCALNLSCSGGTYAGIIPDPAIHIFPNPSGGQFTVRFESPDEYTAVYYRLSDMLGNVVLQENVFMENGSYERVIDLRAKPAGVYVLRVMDACREIEEKIVIIH